jgi:hypothetical protein
MARMEANSECLFPIHLRISCRFPDKALNTMKHLLLLIIPLVVASCSTVDNTSSIAMERDEKRLFDEPSPASDDPSSPLNDFMLQRGRVGLTAATF